MSSELTRTQALNATVKQPSFWRQHAQKGAALCVWLLLIGGYQWYAWRNELGPLEALQQLVSLLATSPWGPLLFIAIYALRPLVLFSATVLTVGAGFVFGPVLGLIYTLVGSNISALVAYSVGRFFGQGMLNSNTQTSLVQRYTEQLRTNSFVTVLTMRFLFLPYDLVNYLAGFLRIDWRAFLLATILGSIPGTVAFVLAGASIEGDFSGGLPSVNPWVFVASAVIFVTSLLISRYLKRREQSHHGQ